MARPVKQRKVCGLPKNKEFGPLSGQDKEGFVNLSVDEYETIRLIDFEGLNQEDCSIQMNIARTTVQGIYSDARRKVAEAIVEGKKLLIDGGHYRICSGDEHKCKIGGCKHKTDRR